MATSDHVIPYDIKMVNHVMPYLNHPPEILTTFPYLVERGLLQRDRIIEDAIANVGGMTIVSEDRRDFCDNSDAKSVTSSYRLIETRPPAGTRTVDRHRYLHRFNVRDIKNKIGTLRIIGLNAITVDFCYFAIPYDAYRKLTMIPITIEDIWLNDGIDFKFNGQPRRSRPWWEFECETFEEMATKQY